MINAAPVLNSARRMRHVMTVGLAVIGAGAAALGLFALVDPAGMTTELARLAGAADAPVMRWQGWALCAIVTVHLAVWALLLWMARGLFDHLAAGDPAAAGQSARRISHLLWAMLLWGVISQMLVSGVVPWGNPVGSRSISIALGPTQGYVVLSALIASFLARAFALGAELWQDHREVI